MALCYMLLKLFRFLFGPFLLWLGTEHSQSRLNLDL